MPGPPVDVDHLPDDPPPGVRHRTLWRLAVCVIHDHQPDAGARRCGRCGVDWPCPHRVRAERVVAAALRPPRPPRSRNQAYLDYLRQFAVPPDPP